MAILKAGAVELPCPVSLSVNDEILWSSKTGRTTDGTMVGDVIAEKKNLTIKWGILDEGEVRVIKEHLRTGFYPISFRDDGIEITVPAYRGTLTKEHMGYIGDGVYYYKSVSVSLIEQ